MAGKLFEVNDVLPATSQLAIYSSVYFEDTGVGDSYYIYTTLGFLNIEWYNSYSSKALIKVNGEVIFEDTNFPLSDNPIIINTLNWTESQRTVTYISEEFLVYFNYLVWEDLAPAPAGYTITFDSNGGTTISDIEEATELPTPLPTPTKSGYTFVAWYYESNFQTRVKAGDTIESNVTLYAKWHNLGSLFTEIADAIRSKDGTSENIRDVDFGERVKQIQPAKEEQTKTVTPNFSSGNQVITPTSGKVMTSVTLTKPTDLIPKNIAKDKNVCGVVGTSFIAIELTQAQYDALSTKDTNTYYLIVED